MTLFIPNCQRVTSLLTHYQEGALGPLDWMRLRLHLALCPPCRSLLHAFEQTPSLLRRVWGEETSSLAEQALSGALRALREGRVPWGPQHHPEPETWQALNSGGQDFLSLLLRVHLAHCAACRDIQDGTSPIPPLHPPLVHPLDEDPLEALRPYLPPEAQWRWFRHGLGGGRVAILARDPITGASLSLASLPGGRRIPRHRHQGQETTVLLSGSLQDGPAHLRAGDWMSHGPGHGHGPTADPGEACWALISLEGPVRFAGWRGVVAKMISRFSATVPH